MFNPDSMTGVRAAAAILGAAWAGDARATEPAAVDQEVVSVRAGVDSIGGWTLVGTSIVAFVVGGVLWADSEHRAGGVFCVDPPPACGTTAERTVMAAEAQERRSAALVMFIVGGVIGSASVLPFALERRKVRVAAPTEYFWEITPVLGPGAAELVVTGRF